MSTKTTFKRIALVAVAALGLGVLSVAPSSATAGAPTLTVTAGSASVTPGQTNETLTAATLNVVGLLSAASDSYTITLIRKSAPSTGGSVTFRLALADTSTADATVVKNGTTDASLLGYNRSVTAYDSTTTFTAGASSAYVVYGNVSYVGARFGLMVDSAAARVAGTYVYTALVQPMEGGVAKANSLLTADLTFTINDTAANVAALSGTVDAGRTKAWINAGSTYTTANDSAVSVVATAAATDHAIIRVTTFNADGNATPESVTATVTGAGVVCTGTTTVCGKSIKVVGTAGSTDFTVRADGTAGVGSIVIATTSKTFPAKTVNFYAKAASTFSTPSVARPVISTSSTDDVVRVTATDASGNAWTGAAYIYATSAASALIAGSETPSLCFFDSGDARHECAITGKATGTATFKIIDASTVALATATSAEVSVRVSTASPASVSLSFDKATYLPGEKAIIKATVLDAAGLALPETTITNLFATGGITNNSTLTRIGTASNALTDVSQTVKGANSSSNPDNLQYAGSVAYMYTMPQSTGTVTLTAKGGTGLPLAGQVTVTASAEVANPSADAATDAANEATDAANAATDAALAAADAADAATAAAQDASDAVAALSATVAKLVASLKAQITSLTNLVIKIQKKVKA